MVRTVKIENFKSISNLEFELGRFNVFIGENGSGKSNLLEAFAMASAAQQITLQPEVLYAKGIRVTRPSLTYSAFKGQESKTEVLMELGIETKEHLVNYPINLSAANPNEIQAVWTDLIEQRLFHYMNEFTELVFDVAIFNGRRMEQNLQPEAAPLLAVYGERIEAYEREKETINRLRDASKNHQPARDYLKDFVIFGLNIPSLRGITKDSITLPLGIHGENIDVHIHQLPSEVREELRSFYKYIQWLGDVEVDADDRHKTEGYKLGKSTSQLFFIDKYLNEKNNLMSAESANEGVLFLLFYLVLFLSPQTPKFFAIDNIEQALNPRLARVLITELARLAKEKNKQALITTHDPAILDGLNLYDDEQRLFVVSRADNGATTVNRVKLNGEAKRDFKLSEMWMRGSLGAVPTNF